jgi:GT2 family glycosyltransferase
MIMQKPKIHVIILNYNCWKDTIECINSLLESTYSNFQIFLIDNNSNDNSQAEILNYLEILKKGNSFQSNYFFLPNINKFDSNILKVTDRDETKFDYPIIFLQSSKNIGFAGANNLIINELINEVGYIWLLNPDMIICKNTLENLVFFTFKKNLHSIVGSITKSYYNRDIIETYGGGKIKPYFATVKPCKNGLYKELDYVGGNSLFTNIENYKQYGLLPVGYFLYWEETDWCYEAKKKGAFLEVCEDAVAYDKGATSIGRGYLSDYYYTRNGLIFVENHYTNFHLFTATVFCMIRIILRILRGQKSRAVGVFYGTLDFYKGKKGMSHE